MTRAKICGVTAHGDRDAAVAAGADAVGVVSGVPVETPREVSPTEAAAIVDGLPPFVAGTLVTMPDGVDAAVDRADRVGPDAVQIHDPARLGGRAALADLRDRLPDRVDLIAAVEAGDPDAPGHAAAADALLVDASDADGGGGTGRTVDWGAARDLRDRIDAPLVLAGGLTPGTVRDAVAAVAPYAVDVASGVERTPGRKDHDAVERFVAAAREPADGAAAARGRTTGGSP